MRNDVAVILSGLPPREKCPFTFITSCQETHRDVVRARILHDSYRRCSVPGVTLPRKRRVQFRQLSGPIKDPLAVSTSLPKKRQKGHEKHDPTAQGPGRNNFLGPTQIRRLPLHFRGNEPENADPRIRQFPASVAERRIKSADGFDRAAS